MNFATDVVLRRYV